MPTIPIPDVKTSYHALPCGTMSAVSSACFLQTVTDFYYNNLNSFLIRLKQLLFALLETEN